MFTGIVESVGTIVAVRPGGAARRGSDQLSADALVIEIEAGELLSELRPGASVAVNGVCLTLVERRGPVGVFEVVPETWRLTNLQSLRTGEPVNVERSLRVGDRLDGHFVQGHVDGLGTIERIERKRGEYKTWVAVPPELMPYIIRKGAVAVDGVSLTVVDVTGERFSVVLIPATLEKTVLGLRRPGDRVNIETDILARLVVARLEATAAGTARVADAEITWQRLQESGFLR